MDPFSDVLALLNPKGFLSARLAAGGDWALRFNGYEGVKFNAVLQGRCWLAVEGVEHPVALQAGDCYLLTDGRHYRLASDLALPTEEAAPYFARATGGVAQVGDTADVMLMGGRFAFDEAHAAMLLDALPPVVHVPAASAHAGVIQWVLARLADEVSQPAMGATLMADHLAHILFVQALRAHAASGGAQAVGWLRALSEPRLAKALGLMHGAPAQRWTVDALASAAGMSRSTFAGRFKSAVGVAPLDYLLRWRMRLAARELRGGRKSVSAVALSLGYESESAFSHAFKRVMGAAPMHFKSAAARAPERSTV
jgi:AraC-like DNA-binding protein